MTGQELIDFIQKHNAQDYIIDVYLESNDGGSNISHLPSVDDLVVYAEDKTLTICN